MFLLEDGNAIRITDRDVGRTVEPALEKHIAGRAHDPLLDLARERAGPAGRCKREALMYE